MADQNANEATQTTGREDFNLSVLPPAGHSKAGPFFYTLFEASLQERRRLELEERWMENHRLYRGDHHSPNRRQVVYKNKKKKQTINLLFANIIRTVANITARNPVAEVVSTDGIEDGTDILVSQKIKNWWNDAEQAISLSKSALNNEIYGITTEKSIYNHSQKRTDTIVVDPFAGFPAPGYFEEWDDAPYFCHAYPMNRAMVANMFDKKVEEIEVDDVYSLLGEDREDNRPIPSGTYFGSQNYPGNYTPVQHPKYGGHNIKEERALVIEIWVRDYSQEDVKEMVEQPILNPETNEPVFDPETGTPLTETVEVVTGQQDKYPGNIRVVTITNHGRLMLDDKPNPNINLALSREVSSKTYLYDHLPFYKANSYEDTTSSWGFAAGEQVGDINLEIDEIVTRIMNYIKRVTNPPLVIPKDTGITKQMITNEPGLILRPISTASAAGIRYLQVPNLPTDFFQALDILIKFFDRIYSIEDADRGAVPNRIVSGAAIAALQERGAVLIRSKIRAVDYLVRMRGRCAISFFQNFGIFPELINAQGTTQKVRGIDLAGREFNYLVESGSTIAKTSLQVQEQAKELYDGGVIDRQAYLETINFPNWKEIIERVSEGQLGQAIQILIQAGLPEDVGKALYQQLMQPQGGPGNRPQGGDGGAPLEKKATGGNSASAPQPGAPPPLAKTEQGQAQPGVQ